VSAGNLVEAVEDWQHEVGIDKRCRDLLRQLRVADLFAIAATSVRSPWTLQAPSTTL